MTTLTKKDEAESVGPSGAPAARVPLTQEEIAELRRFDAGAIGAPWSGWIEAGNLRPFPTRLRGVISGGGRILAHVFGDWDSKTTTVPDLSVLLAARNALPRLLDEAEGLRAWRKEAEALLAQAADALRHMICVRLPADLSGPETAAVWIAGDALAAVDTFLGEREENATEGRVQRIPHGK